MPAGPRCQGTWVEMQVPGGRCPLLTVLSTGYHLQAQQKQQVSKGETPKHPKYLLCLVLGVCAGYREICCTAAGCLQ